MGDKPLKGIRFYAELSGKEPVRDWIKSLTTQEQKILGADLKVIEHSWPIERPLVRSLKNGLWEVRSSLPNRIARIIFMIAKQEMILLHGFIKKTNQTPKQDLTLAHKRQKAFLKLDS